MKVLIFSGGTGSIALQTGFSKLYKNLIDVKVLTNCYDNGKSTGAVRQIFDGKILGPSDLRKNQTTQYKLKMKNDKDPILTFLEIRFDCEALKAEEFCLESLFDLQKYISGASYKILTDAITHFFNQPKSKHITYNDFSLSNIVYAGLAGLNNNSMIAAGKIMSKILNLPEDSVILNDDKSLFLRAETQSGKHILDEGEIVDWNNPVDKIKRVYFVDAHGQIDTPTLSQQSINAINDSDIIIFSSGTQWSSLIPTYLSSGPKFRTIIENSKAKKYLIVNNQPDKDMSDCGIEDILDILYDFIPLDSITKIFNSNSHSLMKMERLVDRNNCYEFNSSVENSKTHNPIIAEYVMELFYQSYLNNKKIVFDYDDTLVGRNNEFLSESMFNMAAIDFVKCYNKDTYIFTGNYIKAINFDFITRNNFIVENFLGHFKHKEQNGFDYKIYADGGVNLYHVKWKTEQNDFGPKITFIKSVDKAALFSNNEIDELLKIIGKIGLNVSKVQNRNNATISIKPVEDEYRVPICLLLNIMTNQKYNIRPSGRTTIDISQHINSKDLSFNDLKQSLSCDERVTYVGDESHEGGNDNIMLKNKMIDYLHVNNPQDTTIFLITLLNSCEVLDK